MRNRLALDDGLVYTNELPTHDHPTVQQHKTTSSTVANHLSQLLVGLQFVGASRMRIGDDVVPLVLHFAEVGNDRETACGIVLREPFWFEYVGPPETPPTSIGVRAHSVVVKALGSVRDGSPCLGMEFDSGDVLAVWGSLGMLSNREDLDL